MGAKIAIFASGSGSNAENIIRHFNTAGSPATVAVVVCNRPGAGVIDRAARLGVPCEILSREQINDPNTMLPLLSRYGIDTIVLAGFLLMVPSFLIHRYDRRIVNIHPSLLPKYGGKGMYGSNIHRAVVAAGEKETGITIHYVSEECDGGEIIFQASIPVLPADTAEDVERKIHALEAEHFPRVIESLL